MLVSGFSFSNIYFLRASGLTTNYSHSQLTKQIPEVINNHVIVFTCLQLPAPTVSQIVSFAWLLSSVARI